MVKPKIIKTEILRERFVLKREDERLDYPPGNGLYKWSLTHRTLPCTFCCFAHDEEHAEIQLKKMLENSIKHGRASYIKVPHSRIIFHAIAYDVKQALFYTMDRRGNLVYENPKSINS